MKEFVIHGYMPTSNFGGLAIEINDTGEAVRIKDTHTHKVSDWILLEEHGTEDGAIFMYNENNYSLAEFIKL